MVDIIDFNNNPFVQQLRTKDQEIERLKNENLILRQAVAKVAGTNDMLKLQMNELLTVLNNFQVQIQNISSGLTNIKTSLPNIVIEDDDGN